LESFEGSAAISSLHAYLKTSSYIICIALVDSTLSNESMKNRVQGNIK
jgi:hypothetical protein